MKRSFMKYTLLNIISSIGLSVYILADTYFIAKGMGANGLAALNLALPVFNFMNGFGLMLGMGGGSRFSMLYCHTDRRETDGIFTNTIIAALSIAAVFELIGLFFSAPFTVMLGADENVFEMSHGYLKMILRFSPAFILNNVMICFMRNDSAPKLAMAGMLAGSLSNIILDYIFIFTMDMGMFGAALATCIAPFISMAVMSIHIITGWNAFQIRFIKPSWKTIKNILLLGSHAFVSEVSGGVVIIVFNFVIYRVLGNTGIAAYGVVANTAIVATAVFTGISSGVQPLMCKYHGQDNDEAVRYILHLALIMTGIIAAAAYSLVFITDHSIVSIFNDSRDAELQAVAEKGMRLYFTCMPFMGFNIVLAVYFTSHEYPGPSQMISLLRGTIFIIPLAFILSALFGINGVWLTVPAAELLTSLAALVLFQRFTDRQWMISRGYLLKSRKLT